MTLEKRAKLRIAREGLQIMTGLNFNTGKIDFNGKAHVIDILHSHLYKDTIISTSQYNIRLNSKMSGEDYKVIKSQKGKNQVSFKGYVYRVDNEHV